MKKLLKRMAAQLGSHHPELLVRIRYFVRFHRRLHLNPPRDLNEKIQYLSLRTDTTAWTRLTDKYEVRDYVRECGLETILNTLYGVWDRAEDIDFLSLPKRFILKATHGSGDGVVVTDKMLLDTAGVRATFSQTLRETYGLAEGNLHYSRIHPRIIAEKLLDQDEWSARHSTSLIDYKFWCFNGRAHYILVCTNRKGANKSELLTYDTAWNPHPEYGIYNDHYLQGTPIPPPPGLDEMIRVAETLAAPFPLVRVDLYNVKGRIVFGEMTFTSLGGFMNYYTPAFLLHAGSLVNLP